MRVPGTQDKAAPATEPVKKQTRAAINNKCALIDTFYDSFNLGVARYERTHVHGGKTITHQVHNGESFKVTCSSGLQNALQPAGLGRLTVESRLAGEAVEIPFAVASTTPQPGVFNLRTRFAVNRHTVKLPKPG